MPELFYIYETAYAPGVQQYVKKSMQSNQLLFMAIFTLIYANLA